MHSIIPIDTWRYAILIRDELIFLILFLFLFLTAGHLKQGFTVATLAAQVSMAQHEY